MATDQKTAQSTKRDKPDGSTGPRLSRRALAAIVAIGAVLVAWFFVAWLALNRHVVDAAGESIGSAFALLLLISIVGAVRGRR
jgi:polyferredoxin